MRGVCVAFFYDMVYFDYAVIADTPFDAPAERLVIAYGSPISPVSPLT